MACIANVSHYNRKKTNVVYIFLEDNESNIAFSLVILILQNYNQRTKSCITVFETCSQLIIDN